MKGYDPHEYHDLDRIGKNGSYLGYLFKKVGSRIF
jgi:hypothetical protein